MICLKNKTKYYTHNLPHRLFFFFLGAGILILFSALQKLIIGADLSNVKGFIVPSLFGGITGLVIGNAVYKIKKELEDRRWAEKELMAKESLLSKSQEIAHVGSWEFDFPNNRLVWSDEVYRILGAEPQEFPTTYEGFLDTVHPEDREAVNQAYIDSLALNQDHYEVEHRLVRRDNGQTRVIYEKFEHQREALGNVIRSVGIMHDITEQKRAEEALRESEGRNRKILHTAMDGFWRVDADTRLLEANKAYCLMSGFSQEELLAMRVSDIEALESTDDVTARLNLIIENGSDRFLSKHRRKDGSIIDVEVSIQYIPRGDEKEFAVFLRDVTDRKETEEKIRQSELRFRASFEHAPVGMAMLDRDRKFIRVNKRLCESLGYGFDELVSRSFNQFTHPDDRQGGRDRWKRMLANEEVFNKAEKRYIHKNGDVVWALVSNSIIRSTDGEPMYILSHFVDISKRKMAEEKLSQERQRLANIVEGTHVGTWEWNVQTGEVFFNELWAEIIGYRLEELSPVSIDTWLENTHPDDLNNSNELLQKHFNGELHYYDCECRMRHKDGHWVWVLDRGKVISWTDDGKPLWMFGTHTDITELKKKELALLESKERYRLTFDAIPDLITISRMEDGRYIYANEGYSKLTGYSRDEVLGKTPLDINIFADSQEQQRMVEELKQTGLLLNYEVQFRKKDGTLWDSYFSARPVQIDGEDYFIASAKDVTEFKKAEEEKARLEDQLRQAQKMEAIGTLAGGIAHDFNNILMAIVGYTELALEDLPDLDQTTNDLEEVLKATTRAKDLIRQILVFSRFEVVKDQPVVIQTIMKEAIKLLRSTIPTTIEINFQLEETPLVVMGDPTQIHQIMINLCTNATQAMGEEGLLEIFLTRRNIDPTKGNGHHNLIPGEYACLSVFDTGPGIDEQNLSKIFDPFFTTKEKGKGTGLGLSVVHGIVTKMGGRIYVQSETGKGSSFEVFIPALELDEQDFKLDRKPLSRGAERILVVDDEPTLVNMIKKFLKKLGYEVTISTDSKEALEVFKGNPDFYDMVIMDQTMPHLTGLKLARKMLSIRPDLPIVLCTGYSESVDPEIAKKRGIREFLKKPIVLRELSSTIRVILDDAPGKKNDIE